MVRTPGMLTDTNSNSLASSRAVIRHDRLALESCLDIDFLSMGVRTRASNTMSTNNEQHL